MEVFEWALGELRISEREKDGEITLRLMVDAAACVAACVAALLGNWGGG